MRRTRRIDHGWRTASRHISNLLAAAGIGTLVIGKNPLWKQEARLGRRTNQTFVFIPHARFIAMLTYKAALVGIQVMATEESYISQASFVDSESNADCPRRRMGRRSTRMSMARTI
jgi:putative transposase